MHAGESPCNPFRCSCQKNPVDRGAWGATVHGARKSLAEAKHTHNQPTIAGVGVWLGEAGSG